MTVPVGQLCCNHGVALIEALPSDLASLSFDSPILHPDTAAEEFEKSLHQGTRVSYQLDSEHPHTVHCTNRRDRLKVFLEHANLLQESSRGNQHISPRLWQMTEALYQALNGASNLDLPVAEIVDYLESLGQFRRAIKLWGATRPVFSHSKGVAAAKQYPQFNLMTGYATPTTMTKLAGEFDHGLIVRPFDPNKNDKASHPLGPWSTASTPNQPRIIYDDGAAFGTPVLAFAADGTAIQFHDALVHHEWFDDRSQEMPATFASFSQHVRQQLPAEVAVCIGGGNLYCKTDAIGNVVRGVKSHLNPQLFINFTQKTSPLQTDFGFEYGIFNQSRGFVFIPKQLSIIGMNQLLMIDDDCRDAFRSGRTRMIWR